jgi:hypothetical protein
VEPLSGQLLRNGDNWIPHILQAITLITFLFLKIQGLCQQEMHAHKEVKVVISGTPIIIKAGL